MKNDFETVIKEVAAFLGKEVTLYIYLSRISLFVFFIKVIDSFIVALSSHLFKCHQAQIDESGVDKLVAFLNINKMRKNPMVRKNFVRPK